MFFLTQTLEREKERERETERDMGGAEDLQRKRENPSSSSSANPPDEISLFLRQVVLRSSVSYSSSSPSPSQHTHTTTNPSHSHFQSLFSLQDTTNTNAPNPNINVKNNNMVDSSGGYVFANVGVSGSNISSSSVGGASENEADEYDCESERDPETLLEPPSKANNNPSGTSSKRSRTAEVHNLSEKRRRSRINEKMKALQSLIPNSNKTDKASMLDEAIEYLKQLQLQVQMLSMRNGLSLHPMCVPGVLQPIQLPEMRIGFGDENGPVHINMTNTLPTEQKTTAQALYGSCNAHASTAEPYLPSMSNIICPENRCGLESPIQAHTGAFQLHSASEEICGEDVMPHLQSNPNRSNGDGFGAPSKPAYSLSKTG